LSAGGAQHEPDALREAERDRAAVPGRGLVGPAAGGGGGRGGQVLRAPEGAGGGDAAGAVEGEFEDDDPLFAPGAGGLRVGRRLEPGPQRTRDFAADEDDVLLGRETGFGISGGRRRFRSPGGRVRPGAVRSWFLRRAAGGRGQRRGEQRPGGSEVPRRTPGGIMREAAAAGPRPAPRRGRRNPVRASLRQWRG